tara:strand:+ start:311 stop:508 length:198 start_codon:yes stop_codon:yes gene_type:complete
MLFGDSAWSELPISTSSPPATNGEVLEHGLLIDEVLDISGEIDSEMVFTLDICRNVSFSVDTSSD